MYLVALFFVIECVCCRKIEERVGMTVTNKKWRDNEPSRKSVTQNEQKQKHKI